MAQKITPCLWFDNQAEEAANFYVSVFPNSEVLDVKHLGEGSSIPGGSVAIASFRLGDQEYQAFDGGPEFKFTHAVSFVIDCDSQEEVDAYWEKLTADGGEESQCGWLIDKFGLSWQVVPKRLIELLQDPDPARAGRATEAMLKMQKIDIATLERAADG